MAEVTFLMLYSNTFDLMFSEVGTAEKLFKTRWLNGAFCPNLKQCKMPCPVDPQLDWSAKLVLSTYMCTWDITLKSSLVMWYKMFLNDFDLIYFFHSCVKFIYCFVRIYIGRLQALQTLSCGCILLVIGVQDV